MVKDRKSRQWHACTVGTTARHRCPHWGNGRAQTRNERGLRQRELDQQLASAADDGWPTHELQIRDGKGSGPVHRAVTPLGARK